jgi:ribosomal subunit interface protein
VEAHSVLGRSVGSVVKETDMEFVLKGRGVRITEQMRGRIQHKLAKVGRLEPRLRRMEVEVIEEKNPRINGSLRVEVAADTARKVFRAHGAGQDVQSALDQVVERLERQITTHRGKLRDRRQGGAGNAPRSRPVPPE